LFEGLGVVQGRVWKDGTPRWEFKCKLHGTKTLNTRALEPRKLGGKESKIVTDRQRKDCDFSYLLPTKLSVKAARKRSILGRSNALPILMCYT
jgi:hypothetical protein